MFAVNVAKGKPTYQSSEGWGGKPDRAVDGNRAAPWAGASCTHTQSDVNAWWGVDLERFTAVKRVEITNRQDCCCKSVALVLTLMRRLATYSNIIK
jgi:hypothetical protein